LPWILVSPCFHLDGDDQDEQIQPAMSSSQPFIQSSPAAAGPRKKSRFTFKHLNLLGQSTTSCPLRVIAHIDLDAFYAQCEMVRLGVAEDQPLAVQQWQGLIAVNYPARAFGLNRFIAIPEAKKLCPQLIMQHVATWREGDDHWAYRPDSSKHIHTDKVSLDPYRLQSRRILATIKESLPPAPIQKVEKASVDEVFLDLSAQIHSILLDRYPELAGPPPYDDPSENLPQPPSTVLNWRADALVDLDSSQTEDDDPDWDDIVMLIGSEIVRDVRKAIRDKLQYTCSAGIARNKMMAKLGSGHKKPNSQTVVRNRAIQHFLSEFKFTKIRNLGGKLGDQVVSSFGTEQLTELLTVPLDQLKAKVGDDTGTWLYGVIRGEDNSEVNSRTQIKSMLSAKSFRPSINSFEQAERWLRIFVADIYARLVEEGVVENKRRPKTMNLHHRQGGQTRSKQLPIPSGRKIDQASLLDLAKTLLGQVIVDGRAWPCANLSLSVGGFEDGITGNRGIGGFLVRGNEAKIVNSGQRVHDSPEPRDEDLRPEKRRKVAGEEIIQRFFTKSESTGEYDEDFRANSGLQTPEHSDVVDPDDQHPSDIEHNDQAKNEEPHQQQLEMYFCKACRKPLPRAEEEEHKDWHFAKDLQDQNQINSGAVGHGSTAVKPKRGSRGSLRAARGGKPPRGQRKLAFG
jgi:DNA polymerase eta